MKTYKDLLNEEFRAENIIREKRIIEAEIEKEKRNDALVTVFLLVVLVVVATVLIINGLK